MAGKAAKVVITERQQDVLQKLLAQQQLLCDCNSVLGSFFWRSRGNSIRKSNRWSDWDAIRLVSGDGVGRKTSNGSFNSRRPDLNFEQLVARLCGELFLVWCERVAQITKLNSASSNRPHYSRCDEGQLLQPIRRLQFSEFKSSCHSRRSLRWFESMSEVDLGLKPVPWNKEFGSDLSRLGSSSFSVRIRTGVGNQYGPTVFTLNVSDTAFLVV